MHRARTRERMEECLRKSCPCLRTLWDRMFKTEKKTDGLERKVSNSDPDREQRYNPSPSAHKLPKPGEPEDSEVYVALWAFEARDHTELSFVAGDRFRIRQRTGDWWTADRLDKSGDVIGTGVVPYNYLERADSATVQP